MVPPPLGYAQPKTFTPSQRSKSAKLDAQGAEFEHPRNGRGLLQQDVGSARTPTTVQAVVR